MRESVDIFTLQMFLRRQYSHVENICKMYRDVRWTMDGPGQDGLFFAKRMNEQVEHLHIYEQDHSVRGIAYAEPEKDFEGRLLPFQRTYICSDPPVFMLASEDTKGRLQPMPWAEAMGDAGLPKAFMERFEKDVAAAIANYGRRRR